MTSRSASAPAPAPAPDPASVPASAPTSAPAPGSAPAPDPVPAPDPAGSEPPVPAAPDMPDIPPGAELTPGEIRAAGAQPEPSGGMETDGLYGAIARQAAALDADLVTAELTALTRAAQSGGPGGNAGPGGDADKDGADENGAAGWRSALSLRAMRADTVEPGILDGGFLRAPDGTLYCGFDPLGGLPARVQTELDIYFDGRLVHEIAVPPRDPARPAPPILLTLKVDRPATAPLRVEVCLGSRVVLAADVDTAPDPAGRPWNGGLNGIRNGRLTGWIVDRAARDRPLLATLELDGTAQIRVAHADAGFSALQVKMFDWPLGDMAVGDEQAVRLLNTATGRVLQRGIFNVTRTGGAYLLWRVLRSENGDLTGTVVGYGTASGAPDPGEVSVSLVLLPGSGAGASKGERTLGPIPATAPDPADFTFLEGANSFTFAAGDIAQRQPGAGGKEAGGNGARACLVLRTAAGDQQRSRAFLLADPGAANAAAKDAAGTKG